MLPETDKARRGRPEPALRRKSGMGAGSPQPGPHGHPVGVTAVPEDWEEEQWLRAGLYSSSKSISVQQMRCSVSL